MSTALSIVAIQSWWAFSHLVNLVQKSSRKAWSRISKTLNLHRSRFVMLLKSMTNLVLQLCLEISCQFQSSPIWTVTSMMMSVMMDAHIFINLLEPVLTRQVFGLSMMAGRLKSKSQSMSLLVSHMKMKTMLISMVSRWWLILQYLKTTKAFGKKKTFILTTSG